MEEAGEGPGAGPLARPPLELCASVSVVAVEFLHWLVSAVGWHGSYCHETTVSA